MASAGIGTVLLFFHHVNPVSVLVSGGGTAHGISWVVVNFSEVVAFAGYSICGFEAAGSIAEEVKEARRALPKAMLLALAVVGGLVIYTCTALILAIPNFSQVMSGSISDPIASTLKTALGPDIGRALLIVLAIGFTSGMIAVQMALSRTVWAAARDNVIPGAAFLVRLSGRENLPRRTIMLSALVSGSLLFINTTQLYSLLVSFSNVGYYICYAMPVLGMLMLKRSGRWTPGNFSLGAWSTPITYIASVWLVLEAINELWPRPLSSTWYLNWGVLIMFVALSVLGFVISSRIFNSGKPIRNPVELGLSEETSNA